MHLRWVALDQDHSRACLLFDQVRALQWDNNLAWDLELEWEQDREWGQDREPDLDPEWDQDLEHQAPFVDPALPHPRPLVQ